MIKFSVLQLDNEGIELTGSEPSSVLDVEDSDFMSFHDNLEYALHASKVKKSVLVTGKVWINVNVECARCLEHSNLKIENTEVCHYYEEPEAELDVTDDIREDILINLPQNYICDENCEGLCPSCCINLNKKRCDCPEVEPEENIWSELDKLNY